MLSRHEVMQQPSVTPRIRDWAAGELGRWRLPLAPMLLPLVPQRCVGDSFHGWDVWRGASGGGRPWLQLSSASVRASMAPTELCVGEGVHGSNWALRRWGRPWLQLSSASVRASMAPTGLCVGEGVHGSNWALRRWGRPWLQLSSASVRASMAPTELCVGEGVHGSNWALRRWGRPWLQLGSASVRASMAPTELCVGEGVHGSNWALRWWGRPWLQQRNKAEAWFGRHLTQAATREGHSLRTIPLAKRDGRWPEVCLPEKPLRF